MKPTDLSELKANAAIMAGRLKLMSHPERLLMLCRMEEGEVSVTELVVLTGLSQSSVSQHLALLREEGVVRIRGEAQTRYASLADRIERGTIHALCALSARAGAAGKGFAVVASEVKRLAEATRTATLQIGDTVRNLDAEVGRLIEESLSATRHAKHAGEGADKIRDVIGRVHQDFSVVGRDVPQTARQGQSQHHREKGTRADAGAALNDQAPGAGSGQQTARRVQAGDLREGGALADVAFRTETICRFDAYSNSYNDWKSDVDFAAKSATPGRYAKGRRVRARFDRLRRRI